MIRLVIVNDGWDNKLDSFLVPNIVASSSNLNGGFKMEIKS